MRATGLLALGSTEYRLHELEGIEPPAVGMLDEMRGATLVCLLTAWRDEVQYQLALVEGEQPTATDQVDSLKMPGGGDVPTGTTFRCAAGAYEVLVFAGHTQETAKLISKARIEVLSGEVLAVELAALE